MNFKYSLMILTIVVSIMACNSSKTLELKPSVAKGKNPTNPTNSFVENIMSKMTLEDKVGEMTQLSIDVLSVGSPYALKEPHVFDKDKLMDILVTRRVGSILNVGGHAYSRAHWEEIISTIQEYARKKSSGIPVLYGIDAIHGTNYTVGATLFPQQIGQASTWNTDIANACGEVTAYETRASGIPWSFSPVLDIGRDARWPRLWETYGEDVLLASKLGAAFIDGMQGDDIGAQYKLAACMKHFVGYSVTLRGKDRVPAWIPERQLREYFLPTFQAAIDAGAMTIMINSGEMNGIPVHANDKILKDLLRDEMGFKGLAVTDWEDISYLVSRHRTAVDFKDAIAQAINAGIDMAMVPMDAKYTDLLKELVEEGIVPMSRINEAVTRILTVKKQLGLFENPYYDFNRYPDFAGEKHQKMALQAAEESLILLKNNDNILPLAKTTKALVVGPNANTLTVLNGGWTGTWQGDNEKYSTSGKLNILEALKAKAGSTILSVNEGEEIKAAKSADVIIACLGEKTYTEKPGDIDDLDIDPAQVKLIKDLKATGKPIILVLMEGRPRIVREIVEDCEAIVLGLLPGDEGGAALANILYGDVNPSGKLPITYPKYSNDLVNYDHKGTDLVHRDFSMNGFNPQWAFGYGLSYTTFDYTNLIVQKTINGNIDVSVTVTNTGEITGKEVVQVYVSDLVASITPSVKRLRAFEKISLESGASSNLKFTISQDELRFVGRDNEWIFEPGEFKIEVGGQTQMVML